MFKICEDKPAEKKTRSLVGLASKVEKDERHWAAVQLQPERPRGQIYGQLKPGKRGRFSHGSEDLDWIWNSHNSNGKP